MRRWLFTVSGRTGLLRQTLKSGRPTPGRVRRFRTWERSGRRRISPSYTHVRVTSVELTLQAETSTFWSTHTTKAVLGCSCICTTRHARAPIAQATSQMWPARTVLAQRCSEGAVQSGSVSQTELNEFLCASTTPSGALSTRARLRLLSKTAQTASA